MTTENQSEKRPKLILGLKKKTEGDQSKTIEGRSKLVGWSEFANSNFFRLKKDKKSLKSFDKGLFLCLKS